MTFKFNLKFQFQVRSDFALATYLHSNLSPATFLSLSPGPSDFI